MFHITNKDKIIWQMFGTKFVFPENRFNFHLIFQDTKWLAFFLHSLVIWIKMYRTTFSWHFSSLNTSLIYLTIQLIIFKINRNTFANSFTNDQQQNKHHQLSWQHFSHQCKIQITTTTTLELWRQCAGIVMMQWCDFI